MEYLEAAKHFDLEKTLLNMKGKPLGEIHGLLWQESARAEKFQVKSGTEAGRMQAEYVSYLGQLIHTLQRDQVINLVGRPDVLSAYRDLLIDLVDRGEISKHVLKQLINVAFFQYLKLFSLSYCVMFSSLS